ncbi:unnamed protein product [Lampetra planeri]
MVPLAAPAPSPHAPVPRGCKTMRGISAGTSATHVPRRPQGSHTVPTGAARSREMKRRTGGGVGRVASAGTPAPKTRQVFIAKLFRKAWEKAHALADRWQGRHVVAARSAARSTALRLPGEPSWARATRDRSSEPGQRGGSAGGGACTLAGAAVRDGACAPSTVIHPGLIQNSFRWRKQIRRPELAVCGK